MLEGCSLCSYDHITQLHCFLYIYIYIYIYVKRTGVHDVSLVSNEYMTFE